MTNSGGSTEDDLFYFESDHLALKGNQDYSEILKTLFVLTAQRERAIKDYSKVVQIKNEALQDPVAVLEKIKNGDDLGIPPMLKVPELPNVNLSKYRIKIPDGALREVFSTSSPVPEKKRKLQQEDTRFKPWTVEEQKRLEELLNLYPPEAVEAKRFEKIAMALGNRTVKQVTSRVQKYFVKLYKAGLPIPGRIPKTIEKNKKSFHRHQRFNHYLWKPTTFFPQHCTPVEMTDDDFDEVPGPSRPATKETTSNYLLPNHTKPDEEKREVAALTEDAQKELQLTLLQKIREEKIKEAERNEVFHHAGFRCDYCNEDPIVGSRWHCVICSNDSVDFCTDCVVAQMYSENPHPISHFLTVYRSPNENPSTSNSDSESYLPNQTHTSDFSDSDDDFNEHDTFNTNPEETNGNPEPSRKILFQTIKEETPDEGSDKKSESDEFFDLNSPSDYFSDTQLISYDYLHSSLLFDDDHNVNFTK